MTRIVVVFFAVVCLTSQARAELIGHWAFDAVENGTAPNLGTAGAELNGKLVGDARLQSDVSDGTISRGSVLSLDGTGDWMQIDHPIMTFGQGNSFTIAAWVKTDAKSMALFGKGNANGRFEGHEKIFFIDEGFSGRPIGFVANGQNWLASRSVKVNDGRWRHVAVTYDAQHGTKAVFVDGRDVTTETAWVAGPDLGETVRIGATDWGDVSEFNGHIDDLAIFNEALSPYQLRNVMRRGPAQFDALPEGLNLAELNGDLWQQLMQLTEIMRREDAAFERREIEAEKVQLGPWHCVGPFKDLPFGNVLESFNHPFAPEQDVLAAGDGPVDLKKVYRAKKFPGMKNTQRRWIKHPEWVDGYRHQLPRGPAPSRNETVYLYRTITTQEPMTVEMNLYAEDSIGGWLGDEKLGESHRAHSQPSRFPSALCVPLKLRAGENRLLLKLTSIHAAHGFAFGIPGLTPVHPLRPGQGSPEVLAGGGTNFTPLDRPYASEEPIGVDYPKPEDLESCVAEIAARLSIPRPLVAELFSRQAAADRLPTAQALCWRLAHHQDALKRVRRFKFDVTMTPMFDPPKSLMDEKLHQEYPPSPGGKAYIDVLGGLKKQTQDALARDERGDAGSIDAVTKAGNAIERMWRDQIGSLPPIAFIRCPHFSVDARAPYSAVGAMPASICVFDPSQPETPPRVVFHEPETVIFDMNLSFDAKTIFFSARRKGVPGGWQIYEIGVDGNNLRQITDDNSDNISPCLLPSGEIVFVSTRAGNWVICAPRRSGLLYVCNRDGSNVRKLSVNIDSDHTPQVMDDGRVLFTRWDYGVEKNVFARHAMWTMNPDGTGFRLFFGNTIEDPAGFWQARPIPGRPEVVCTFGPHHTYQAGMFGLVWNQLGPEAPRGEGFRFITDEIPSYCDTTFGYGYQDPLAVNERQFLVSYGGDGQQKNRLYLVDDRGNRKCLYEAAGNLSCWSPLLLKPRATPPVIVPQADNPEFVYRDPVEANRGPETTHTGTLLVHDVYQGLLSHVERGEAKYIQIMEQLPKTQEHLLDAWGTSPLISRGTVHVRRLIGTVPIESDGSAHFTVPALRNISLNVLSAEGKLLMRMGSDMHVMPGERQSCIGCHENRGRAIAPADWSASSLAARREPSTPKRPDWGTRGIVDYVKVVQPVWDKYCIECHDGETPDGSVDLTGDKTRFFNMSYDNIVERDLVNYHNVFGLDHDENAPKTIGSLISKICDYIDTDQHSGHTIPLEDRQRVYTWIDANVPYYATYVYSRGETVGSRDAWGMGANMKGAKWTAQVRETFQRRCMSCHERQVYNPSLYGGPATVSSKIWTYRGITAHAFPWRWPTTAMIGPELRINLTNPSHSLMLTAPLAKEAGGLGMCRDKDGRPYIFADRNDPDYKTILAAIREGKAALYARPRVDMDLASGKP